MDHYEMILKDHGDTVLRAKGHNPETTHYKMEERIREKYRKGDE